MAGRDHEFRLLSRAEHPISRYPGPHDKDAVKLHDDLSGYLDDSLHWIATFNPATSEATAGLNRRGLTIIAGDGASAGRRCFTAWADLFDAGPPVLQLTGDRAYEEGMPPEEGPTSASNSTGTRSSPPYAPSPATRLSRRAPRLSTSCISESEPVVRGVGRRSVIRPTAPTPDTRSRSRGDGPEFHQPERPVAYHLRRKVMHARLTRGTRRLPTWLVGVTLAAVGATLLVGGSPRRAATPSVSTPQLLPTRLRASLPVTPALRIAPKTLSIEQIRVGDRVLAGNPEGENSAETEVDAGRWRKLELTLGDGDGRLDIALLRPADWVVDVGAGPGSVVRLDLPEVGAEGLAQVRSVGPCPPVRTGPGRVVTGTFAHASAEVIDLAIAGESEPIGVTARHRFYSEDRRSFVPAGRLREGERIRQLDGVARVASIRPRPGRHRVYNLEVNREHVFRVGARGLLVHNEYLQVDPGDLHVPASRPDGADFFKLTKQMKDFGDSFAGMPAIDVRRGAGGSLEIVNGVTRATRAFLSAPGSKVLVRVIEEAPGVRFLEATIRALHP